MSLKAYSDGINTIEVLNHFFLLLNYPYGCYSNGIKEKNYKTNPSLRTVNYNNSHNS